MTSQKLLGTLKFLDSLDKSLGIQNALEAVLAALEALVGSPALPDLQSELATSLGKLQVASEKLGESVAPSQANAIADMGGSEYFAGDLYQRVKDAVSANAMTPSVARDFTRTLSKKRSVFLQTVRNALESLGKLGITDTEVGAGDADVAFLVPRDLFENHLGDFATELKFIDRLVRDVSEAKTGVAAPVELKTLSSSVPTISLAASAVVLGALATVVKFFLDSWKTLEEIRDIRSRVKKVGLSNGPVEEQLDAQITTVVETVVEEATTVMLAEYKGDSGRKNELEAAIRQDMKRLFGQIERGLTLEFRASPKEDSNIDEDAVALQTISTVARELKFPPVALEPLLLESGEVLEGDIKLSKVVKHSSTKTTKTKKTGKQEPKATD